MRFEFQPTVKLLLQNESNEQVKIKYMKESWSVPKIGPRPPYYAYPKYEPSYALL